MHIVQASRAEANQRVLVRKSLHQLGEYNNEQFGLYLQPVTALAAFTKNWDKNIEGLSAEEVADLEDARAKLENYGKIYDIFEYASELNELMYVIEMQISSNNPSYPMSVYRRSESTSTDVVLGDIEKILAAYYSLIDDCEGYPEWQHKIELDLGGTVSYLALTLDDTSRDSLVDNETFLRFDAEKQKYFK